MKHKNKTKPKTRMLPASRRRNARPDRTSLYSAIGFVGKRRNKTIRRRKHRGGEITNLIKKAFSCVGTRCRRGIVGRTEEEDWEEEKIVMPSWNLVKESNRAVRYIYEFLTRAELAVTHSDSLGIAKPTLTVALAKTKLEEAEEELKKAFAEFIRDIDKNRLQHVRERLERTLPIDKSYPLKGLAREGISEIERANHDVETILAQVSQAERNSEIEVEKAVSLFAASNEEYDRDASLKYEEADRILETTKVQLQRHINSLTGLTHARISVLLEKLDKAKILLIDDTEQALRNGEVTWLNGNINDEKTRREASDKSEECKLRYITSVNRDEAEHRALIEAKILRMTEAKDAAVRGAESYKRLLASREYARREQREQERRRNVNYGRAPTAFGKPSLAAQEADATLLAANIQRAREARARDTELPMRGLGLEPYMAQGYGFYPTPTWKLV